MPGGYESIASVIGIVIDYNVTKEFGPKKIDFDIFMTVSYNDGQSFDKEQTIAGHFKDNLEGGTNNIKSWGSAFKIRNFFECTLNKKGLKLNEDFTVPDQWIDDAIGKEYMVCSYPTTNTKRNGKPFWNTFDIVAPPDAERGTLKAKVMEQVEGRWIKNYRDENDHGNNSNNQDEPAKDPAKDKSGYNLDI